MEIQLLEETDVVKVTTLEPPPVGSSIHRGLEIKEKDYSNRLGDKNEPWFHVFDFRKRHVGWEKFRDLNYKYFLVKWLLKAKSGEGLTADEALNELWKIVGIVDFEIFKNAFLTIHMYLTGQLPLPADELANA